MPLPFAFLNAYSLTPLLIFFSQFGSLKWITLGSGIESPFLIILVVRFTQVPTSLLQAPQSYSTCPNLKLLSFPNLFLNQYLLSQLMVFSYKKSFRIKTTNQPTNQANPENQNSESSLISDLEVTVRLSSAPRSSFTRTAFLIGLAHVGDLSLGIMFQLST